MTKQSPEEWYNLNGMLSKGSNNTQNQPPVPPPPHLLYSDNQLLTFPQPYPPAQAQPNVRNLAHYPPLTQFSAQTYPPANVEVRFFNSTQTYHQAPLPTYVHEPAQTYPPAPTQFPPIFPAYPAPAYTPAPAYPLAPPLAQFPTYPPPPAPAYPLAPPPAPPLAPPPAPAYPLAPPPAPAYGAPLPTAYVQAPPPPPAYPLAPPPAYPPAPPPAYPPAPPPAYPPAPAQAQPQATRSPDQQFRNFQPEVNTHQNSRSDPWQFFVNSLFSFLEKVNDDKHKQEIQKLKQDGEIFFKHYSYLCSCFESEFEKLNKLKTDLEIELEKRKKHYEIVFASKNDEISKRDKEIVILRQENEELRRRLQETNHQTHLSTPTKQGMGPPSYDSVVHESSPLGHGAQFKFQYDQHDQALPLPVRENQHSSSGFVYFVGDGIVNGDRIRFYPDHQKLEELKKIFQNYSKDIIIEVINNNDFSDINILKSLLGTQESSIQKHDDEFFKDTYPIIASKIISDQIKSCSDNNELMEKLKKELGDSFAFYSKNKDSKIVIYNSEEKIQNLMYEENENDKNIDVTFENNTVTLDRSLKDSKWLFINDKGAVKFSENSKKDSKTINKTFNLDRWLGPFKWANNSANSTNSNSGYFIERFTPKENSFLHITGISTCLGAFPALLGFDNEKKAYSIPKFKVPSPSPQSPSPNLGAGQGSSPFRGWA